MLMGLEPFCYELAVEHQRTLRETVAVAPSDARGAGPAVWAAVLSQMMRPVAGPWRVLCPLFASGCDARSSHQGAA
jgi:hypothetical protein